MTINKIADVDGESLQYEMRYDYGNIGSGLVIYDAPKIF